MKYGQNAGHEHEQSYQCCFSIPKGFPTINKKKRRKKKLYTIATYEQNPKIMTKMNILHYNQELNQISHWYSFM